MTYQFFYFISVACVENVFARTLWPSVRLCLCGLFIYDVFVFEIIGGIDLIRNSSADRHLIAFDEIWIVSRNVQRGC